VDDVARRVLDAIDATGIPYERIDCDPELADTAAFCAHYGYAEDQSANTIVVASRRPEGHHAACVVLATTRLDVNKTVRSRLGVRKVSFAPPELTAELTGMVMGGVTPFALPADLPLWIDARVMEPEWVILGGGSRSLKVKIAPAVLEAVGGEVVEGLAMPAG
jgi:prolyl-tRNA editing enzyme YbaK/EbsC (Cys-tRNA(Pro) deacylase)